MERFSKNDISITAVIPARGGSKGILRKNISLVGGKPLIAWTILEALKCKGLKRVVVNTDDREIADVSLAYGAEVIMRPSELAQDDTSVFEALNYGLNFYHLENQLETTTEVDTHTLQLNPTAPLRTSTHIQESIDLLISSQADSVVSVCEAHTHPYWCKKINEEGDLEDFSAEGPDKHKMRQSLPKVYALNGAIFLTRNSFIRQYSYYLGKTVPYIMPADCSIDIDTPWQMYIANLILNDRAA